MGVSDTVGFVLYRVIYSLVQVLPWQVTVYAGTGAVWENPTCGLPILNPIPSVLYHPSSGWVSLTFGQDPLHSDNDVTQYMWHSPL